MEIKINLALNLDVKVLKIHIRRVVIPIKGRIIFEYPLRNYERINSYVTSKVITEVKKGNYLAQLANHGVTGKISIGEHLLTVPEATG